MLPGFRLIAATFLCGFFVVFASLRVVTSLHNVHGALPITAAQAAPMPTTDIDSEAMRRSQAAMPAMYDMRFVVSTASHAPVPERMTARAIDRAAPVVLPLVITTPLLEDAGEDQASAATIEANLPAMPAPDTAEVEPPEILAMVTAVPDRDGDAPVVMLVNVPLPRAAQRPTLADKKPARYKPIGTKPFGTTRRIAAQDPFGNTPLINIFNTPPDPN